MGQLTNDVRDFFNFNFKMVVMTCDGLLLSTLKSCSVSVGVVVDMP